MSEQAIRITQDNCGETVQLVAVPPPPDRLIMRDELGQEWAITVHPDGVLCSELLSFAGNNAEFHGAEE